MRVTINGQYDEIRIQRTLLKTMQEEIKSMRKVVNIDYSPITINRYVNVLNKLKTAVPRFYGKEYITFLELTPDFIKAFDTFLKTEAAWRSRIFQP